MGSSMQSADRARSLARLSARLITVRSRVQIASGPSLFRGIVVLIVIFLAVLKIGTAYGRKGDRLEDQTPFIFLSQQVPLTIQNVYEDRTVSCPLMSKRSVDKGDGGKKTSVDAKDAKPRDASSTSLEKKANAQSKADTRQNSDLYLVCRIDTGSTLSLRHSCHCIFAPSFPGIESSQAIVSSSAAKAMPGII